jgi:hypothetical protein
VIESDAEKVPGVVAVENDLQVEGYGRQTHPAAPDSIRHRATQDIFWDPRVGTGKVSVDVAPDGDVTLNGVVDSWGGAQAARDDAIAAGAAHVIDPYPRGGRARVRPSRSDGRTPMSRRPMTVLALAFAAAPREPIEAPARTRRAPR